MMQTYTGEVTVPPEYPEIEWSTFWNTYGTFTDTNNLSVVSFLHYKDFHVVIPGDLEWAGWKELLKRDAFRAELRRTSVFIAPHHGCENGYCREVFDFCSPAVVVFSDSSISYVTQEMTNTYASHATGVEFNGQRRFVLTTRNDGSLAWTY